MKVNVLRSGGFAGIPTAWELKIDDQPDPKQWLTLVDSCPWDDPDRCSPGQDRFVYRLSAGTHSTTLGEEFVRGPWRELVDRVREAGKRVPIAQARA